MARRYLKAAAPFVVGLAIGGVLMPPEFCTVIDEEAGTVFFRGELLQV